MACRLRPQRYFGKDCSDLTLSECAVLAAIPQNPYLYNPIRHPDENAKRRTKVLDNMLEQGYITQAEYDEAMADNVYDRIQATDSQQETSPYSYFIDEMTSQITNDLQEKLGYTEVQAQNALYSGGLRIYTTQDPDIQAILDEEYQNEENFPANTRIGIDWALTVQKPDGTTQNYSKEMMKLTSWTRKTISSICCLIPRRTPRLISTPIRTTFSPTIHHCGRAAQLRTPAPVFHGDHGSAYRIREGPGGRPRKKGSQPDAEPGHRYLPAAGFHFQAAGCVRPGYQ